MAMKKRLWSVNGLATETGMDRRTVASRLRDVSPRGTVRGGHAGYWLEDLLRATPPTPSTAPSQSDEKPDLGHLSAYGDDLVLVALGMTHLVQQAPALAASLAVASGASMATAALLKDLLTSQLMAEADAFLKQSGATAEFAVRRDQLADCNWNKLAENAGEPVDHEAWEAFKKQRLASIGLAA